MQRSQLYRKSVCLMTALAVGGTMALSGCATSGGQGLQAKYGDASDRCAAFRQPLIATDEDFSAPIVQDAVIGALAGALIGGLTGGGKGALIGAAAGGLTGAGAGYLQAKQRDSQNKSDVLAAIDTDASRDSKSMGPVGNAIRGLRQCRSTQAEQTAMNVERRKITKAEGQAQIAAIKSQTYQDGELIQAVLGKADERVKTYVDARAKAMNPGNPQVAANNLRNNQTNPTSKASYDLNRIKQTNDDSQNQQNQNVTNAMKRIDRFGA